MCRPYRTHGKIINAYDILSENMNIIAMKSNDVRMWKQFILFRIGSRDTVLRTRFRKDRELLRNNQFPNRILLHRFMHLRMLNFVYVYISSANRHGLIHVWNNY
jgi:hypothetical protein